MIQMTCVNIKKEYNEKEGEFDNLQAERTKYINCVKGCMSVIQSWL